MKFDGRFSLDGGAHDEKKLLSLANYVARQLDSTFPAEGQAADVESIFGILPATIERLKPILRAVRCFNAGSFDYYNSLQYSTFLYLLANQQSRAGVDRSLSERLFCLNRALNALDLFFSVELPEIFFISHGVGSVLGDAKYGNRLVFFQNVTVGRVGEMRPQIGNNVVLYPGAIITGKTILGDNCVVSAGTVLHNVIVPENTIVKLDGGKPVFKENMRDYVALYLEPDTGS